MQNPNFSNRAKLNNQGAQQQTNQTSNAADEKPFIEILEYSKFPSSCDCGIITTQDIAEKISEIMSAAYKDFAGCIVTPAIQNQGIVITFYFMPREAQTGKARAFTVEGSGEIQPKSSILANLQATEARMRSNVFKPTQEGSRGLARYMYNDYTCNNGKDVNWNMLANVGALGEKADAEFGVLQVVTGVFDITKFLKDIYGTKGEGGDVYQYGITPIRPQSQTTTMSATCVDWLIMLTRFEMKQLTRAGQKCGIVGLGTGTTQMVGRSI